MKSYAIITDIHGNASALAAVLEDIKQRKADHIFCLGDMVGIGPDSNEVMSMLLDTQNVSYVLGNHELAVAAAFRGEDPPLGHHNERAHHQWLADRIDKHYIEFITDLPKKIIYEVLGYTFYFAHYHLDMTDHYLPIEKNPSIEQLDSFYSSSGYDLVCFGHHHVIHHVTSDRRVYFNPGSLGCNHKPIARYGLVDVSESGINVESIQIPYDNTDFLNSYEKLKVPDREFILKIFHGAYIF
ncbi:phosphodiesterase [Paenibacillus sp. J45TS6]|uniref:metallophosphoesterase family protein n=1 Tax=Paenibacillus sp. J45TS6 TaxID=2807196 RepID=UPI001B1CEAE6|nr:metallophosphoesterase family protein [Paenibacillus sp. J45TS6]GIP44638.1 phosphodiesterase [Paenibacillus sp. J45TS6]